MLIKIKAAENIECGMFITVENYILHPLVGISMPDGMAARDIVQGEMVNFNSEENTKDIVVYMKRGV